MEVFETRIQYEILLLFVGIGFDETEIKKPKSTNGTVSLGESAVIRTKVKL